MKNLTPQHLRCHVGCCPSVHELEDGRLLIVGKRTSVSAEVLATMNLATEEAVIIDRELLAGVCATPARADGDGGGAVHDELLRISDELSGRELYGAAQAMVRGARAIYALKAEVERLRAALSGKTEEK